MIRVLVVDDQRLVREGVVAVLVSDPEIDVVGEAANGAEAARLARTLAVDVILMDIQMPELTGLEVLRRLRRMPDIVFTTAYDQYAVTAFELNAVDYLLKPFTRARFDAAVARSVAYSRA